MQTFLPYEDFKQSARVLDMKRCGKQRLEALDILRINLDIWDSKQYRHHPAVLMWKGHEYQLVKYMKAIIDEWTSRGYKDTRWETWLNLVGQLNITFPIEKCGAPDWLGDQRFHSSHRSALLYKNYDYYKKFKWQEEPKLDYMWPIRINQKQFHEQEK